MVLPRTAAAVLVLLAGCCGEPADAPPEIRVGLEECRFCRMIISEVKYAAAAVDEAGGRAVFDDVGCLIQHLSERPASPNKVWVRDHDGDDWIAVGDALFVRDPQGATPMGSGLMAFASREAAETFARELGVDVADWAALEPVPRGP